MRILAVYYGHDANCTLLEDGEPVAVLEKERLTRIKHDQGQMDLEAILADYGWAPETIDIIAQQGDEGAATYLIENFRDLITPFAETLTLFDVDNVSVVTGLEGDRQPISAIHPHAVDAMKNDMLQKLLGGSVSGSAPAGDQAPAPEKS